MSPDWYRRKEIIKEGRLVKAVRDGMEKDQPQKVTPHSKPGGYLRPS